MITISIEFINEYNEAGFVHINAASRIRTSEQVSLIFYRMAVPAHIMQHKDASKPLILAAGVCMFAAFRAHKKALQNKGMRGRPRAIECAPPN